MVVKEISYSETEVNNDLTSNDTMVKPTVICSIFTFPIKSKVILLV